ncbi:hypothetical protein [Paenibacillus sp. GM2FR]|nr:hypothetical protein [Paenibacillus sp. GM2FR]
MGLKPGESASMTAVWIQFPSLTIAPPCPTVYAYG